MKYGVLEHCGTKENEYPIVLSNDKDLQDWIAKLQGKGVYIGVQVEWIDWVPCFSKESVSSSTTSYGFLDSPRRQRQAHQDIFGRLRSRQ